MKRTMRVVCAGLSLAVSGWLGGCATTHVARSYRIEPVCDFSVVKSSFGRELSPEEMGQLQAAVQKYLATRGLVSNGDYFVRLDFAPVAPGTEGEWVIVKLTNISVPAYAQLASYLEEEPEFDGYPGYDEPAFFGLYDFYAPWDFSYGGYRGTNVPFYPHPRTHQPGPHEPGDHQPGNRTAGGDYRPHHPRLGPDGKPDHDYRPRTAEYVPRVTDPNRRRGNDHSASSAPTADVSRWRDSASGGRAMPVRSASERSASATPAPARSAPVPAPAAASPSVRSDPTPASSSRASDSGRTQPQR